MKTHKKQFLTTLKQVKVQFLTTLKQAKNAVFDNTFIFFRLPETLFYSALSGGLVG